MQTCRLGEAVHIGLNSIALVQFGGEPEAAQRAEAVEHKWFGERGALDAGGFLQEGRELFFQEVERGSGLAVFLLDLRLRKGFLVHFLVDVEGDGLDLHSDGRHHIRRLPLQDEGVQGLDVNLPLADYVCGQEFSAAFLLEGLYGNVFDIREFPDDSFHFFEFYAESADFHLSVFSADELDVAVGAVAHDVAGTVEAPEGRV